jgi:DNA processing protein
MTGALCDVLGIAHADRAGRIRRAETMAARALREARAAGTEPLALTDARYPSYLREIPDPPIVLWVNGAIDVLNQRIVAIVGSRRATPPGLAIAERLARDASDSGLVVVSGLARGVDAAAHRGALKGATPTIAVLGCGADIVYPREHDQLAADIRERGAVVTEYPPGTLPYPSNFPLRNRIISGLSRAVVVVEASRKSGSLITARAASEQGRSVLAVPGGVATGCHDGCHALIKDGGRLVETVEDILDEVYGVGLRPTHVRKSITISGLASRIGPGEVVGLDQLADRTGRPARELLVELAGLELDGVIRRLEGGGYTRA